MYIYIYTYIHIYSYQHGRIVETIEHLLTEYIFIYVISFTNSFTFNSNSVFQTSFLFCKINFEGEEAYLLITMKKA